MYNNNRCACSIVVLLAALLLASCSSRNDPPNNPPVASAPVTTTVDEGAALVSGQLTSTDPDDGATASFTITAGSSSPAGFVLNTDGSYSFDPANVAYDHLSVGSTELLSIPVTVTDDKGATDTTQIEISVNGTNDAPIAGAPATANADVGAAVINGQLTSSDVDDVSTAAFSITPPATAPAGFLLNTDGRFSFDPADPAYVNINVGSSQLVTVDVTVTDDQAASDTTQVQVTVSGVNNVPVAIDDSYDTFGNTLLEVGVAPSGSIAVTVSGSVLDNDSDADVTDVLIASLETAPVSGSVILDAQGQFTYTPLTGQTATTDSFTYRVTDGTSFAIATVNINITERIWYVDNLRSGLGTSADPFATLAQAELVVGAGDTIYIANGDGSTLGLDAGLTLAVPNVTLTGEGVALVIDSNTLTIAGIAPSITNTSGAGITLNAADNTLIMGLNISGVLTDGLLINDSIGVVLDSITISNSGESAIQGSGADVELSLADVIIDAVDTMDSTVSDDAIFIAATTSSTLIMSGGSINGVPGNLGDGIEIENAVAANPVSMALNVTGVSFSNITQDGIKLDNDNGVMDVQIGGSTVAEGNVFDVGFRGIQIQTDADPSLTRTNNISIQNNNITSGNEGIQIRSVTDISNLSILDNALNSSPTGNVSDLIDIQAELASTTQARVNRNAISNLGGSDGIKVRVFDQATLTMEVLDNAIDGPDEGFDLDVFGTGLILSDTFLNSSILNNTLSNIATQAMNARNASASTETCLDLQGNSAVADYVLDAVFGTFFLTAASQAIVLDPAGGSFSDPGSCPTPTF